MSPQSTMVPCICIQCDATFLRLPFDVARGRTRFCSRACAYAWRTKPRAERFWALVLRVDDADSCWLWLGARNGGRGEEYGAFGWTTAHRSGRLIGAHVASWMLEHGCEVPDGLIVLHLCNVPLCVRPSHLKAGTQAANLRQMMTEQRKPTKLGDNAVLNIRTRYAAGGITQAALAEQYGVSKALIGFVITRRIYQHL